MTPNPDHDTYIYAAYAAFVVIWLGLIVDTWLRAKRGPRD